LLRKHTIFLKLRLVTFTTDNLFLHGLRFFRLGLDGNDPAGALSSSTRLEGVLVSAKLEVELVEAIPGDIGDLSLEGC
jgi:hypothetical protein